MVLEFGRPSGREGNAGDDGDVIEESESPFDFLVDILEAVSSPVTVSILLPLWRREGLTLHVGYQPPQGELETIPRWR